MFNTGDTPTPGQRSLLSELSAAVGQRKVKMGLLDSDSDDDYLDFLKKENPKTALSTTKTMKVANLDTDSGSGSGTESIADDYSDDSFATSEKSEETIQPKIDSPKSLKSSRSAKSIPDNDDSSVDDLLATSKPFSKTVATNKSVKVDDSIDELLAASNPFLKKTPRNDETIAEIVEEPKSQKSSKSQSPRKSKSSSPPLNSARSNVLSNPEAGNEDSSRRSSLKKSTSDGFPVPAPRSRASSEAPETKEEKSQDVKTSSIPEPVQESENPIPIAEENKEALKEIFSTAIENENTEATITKKKRPDSAFGRRMQKLIESRRNGSAEGAAKLPENYTGLGSTRALEDLQKYKENGLNEELNGARGQRKMAYLAWLKKKEETRQKEEERRKKKAKEEKEEQAKKNKPKPKTVQAAKTMGPAAEGWLKNKEEYLNEKARKEREKKRKEAEEKREAEEEKKANEKLVKQYRERKEKEYQEKVRKQREIEQEKQRELEEAKMEKRIQSAKMKTEWEKKKQKQIKKQKQEQQALERELTQTQMMQKDEKIQNGRRAYEEWQRRKKLEAKETKMWTLSYEDFTEEIRPFY